MGCDVITREIARDRVFLDHPEPQKFTTCQWKWPPILYVCYRVFMMFYFMSSLFAEPFLDNTHGRWFIFITNWTFVMVNVRNILMAVNATWAHWKLHAQKDIDESTVPEVKLEMTCMLKAQWVMYNVSTAWSIIITIIYWSLLWHPSRGVTYLSFTKHASTSIYVTMDLVISATPIYLLHIIHPFWYSLIYGMFSLVYLLSGGTDHKGNNYIYHILDIFGNLKISSGIGLALQFVFLPGVWMFVFLVKYGVEYLAPHKFNQPDPVVDAVVPQSEAIV